VHYVTFCTVHYVTFCTVHYVTFCTVHYVTFCIVQANKPLYIYIRKTAVKVCETKPTQLRGEAGSHFKYNHFTLQTQYNHITVQSLQNTITWRYNHVTSQYNHFTLQSLALPSLLVTLCDLLHSELRRHVLMFSLFVPSTVTVTQCQSYQS
jgi:hypothetical protein